MSHRGESKKKEKKKEQEEDKRELLTQKEKKKIEKSCTPSNTPDAASEKRDRRLPRLAITRVVIKAGTNRA